MKNDFLTRDELAALGLRSVGRAVSVSRHALLFGPENITIGDFSRIDAYSILSAGRAEIVIGRHVHVGAYCALLGQAGVSVGDYASLSPRCLLISSNDDFSGEYLAGPTLPGAVRDVHNAHVTVERYAMLGAGSIVLPGITVGVSAAVGAMSLVKQDVAAFEMVAGVPAVRIGARSARHRRLVAEAHEPAADAE